MRKHLPDYESMVVLTHFRGHGMGGCGGSMKNIAIGFADGTIDKKMVHEVPDNENCMAWLSGLIYVYLVNSISYPSAQLDFAKVDTAN